MEIVLVILVGLLVISLFGSSAPEQQPVVFVPVMTQEAPQGGGGLFALLALIALIVLLAAGAL